MVKQHASLLLCNIHLFLSLFITTVERQHFTYSNDNIQGFNVFSQVIGILKENISQHHIIILMMVAREIFCYEVEAVLT